MSIIQFIKNILKRFFPPPTKSFMREINDLKQQITLLSEGNERLLGELAQTREDNAMILDVITRTQEENVKLLDKVARLQEDGHRLFDALNHVHEEQGILLSKIVELQANNAKLANDSSRTIELIAEVKSGISILNEEHKRQQAETVRLLGESKSKLEAVSKSTDKIYTAIPIKPLLWHNEFERGVVKASYGKVTELPDFQEKYLRLISGLDVESVRILTRILIRQGLYLNSDQKEIDLFTREEQEEMRLLKEYFYKEIFKISDNMYAYRHYLLPVNHFESSVFYYRHGIDELKTLDRVKGKAVIDVGGYIGDSVLVLEELNPQIIYSFEADPDNFALMQKTLAINNLTNVVAVPMALGNYNGTSVFHKGESCSGTVFRDGIQYSEDIEVPQTTLDDYVAEHPMEIGLIKVDIEGGEPFFLEGAKKTICEQRPIILLSIYHNAHDFFELKPLLESWNLGYSFHIHKPTFGSATGETLLLAEILNE